MTINPLFFLISLLLLLLLLLFLFVFIYLFLFYFLFFYTSQCLFMVILCRPHWLV